MKASIKFREDQKPLVRAKVPLSILGLPFQSGVVAGESKELALSLGTFFDSGPSLKFAYRPNDSLNPFGLVFKTGIGHFGSPISSPMTMSAEFNLIGSQNPSFFVHFKPQFGDFCIKKSQSSEFVKKSISKSKSKGVLSDDDGSMEVIETPPMLKSRYSTENGLLSGKQTGALRLDTQAANLIGGLLIGMEASAKTSLPVLNCAVVNFRWGFRFPASAEEAAPARENLTAGVAIQKFPLLVMNKIGIEHVADINSKHSTKVGPGLSPPRDDDVAETCLAVKRQLELIQAENGKLRKAMDDLRSEFSAGKSALPATVADGGLGKNGEGERGVKTLGGRADRRSNSDKKSSELHALGGKAAEGNTKEELRKAAMVGAGA